MKSKLQNIFLLFTISFLLASCNGTSPTTGPVYSIQGAFFGSTPGQTILLTNKSGSIQHRQQLSELGSYEFQVPVNDAQEGKFYLIYTYDNKPKLNPEPPYIQFPLAIQKNLFLPAILVFDLNLAHFRDTSEKNKIFFNWNKAIFSQEGTDSHLELIASFEEGFPFKDKVFVKTNVFPYAATHGYADLTSKIKNKKITLKERFPKETCNKVNCFVKLHYRYPEGIELDYASNPIVLNMCNILTTGQK